MMNFDFYEFLKIKFYLCLIKKFTNRDKDEWEEKDSKSGS